MLTREAWYAALTERHGAALQEKFTQAEVAVCGLGGLGSNIAVALARAGIGKLRLFDFAGRISRNIGKNDFMRSLVTGQFVTEVVDLLFR